MSVSSQCLRPDGPGEEEERDGMVKAVGGGWL